MYFIYTLAIDGDRIVYSQGSKETGVQQRYGAVGDTNSEQSIVSYLRIKQSKLLLATFFACTLIAPPCHSYDDRSTDALKDARDELLKKQDELQREEDNLQRDVDALKKELSERNEPSLEDELKDRRDRLAQVESELGRTQDALKDVEQNLRR
jgi:septal ring factor EnvC (AmiA/AmiB activator)